MQVEDLDPGAIVERTIRADKVLVTAINMGRDSAFVSWERGHMDGADFVLDFLGNVSIEDRDELRDDEGNVITPAKADYTKFMELIDTHNPEKLVSLLTKKHAHDSEAWLVALRATKEAVRL